jgi:hypothetical protein
MIFHVFGLYGSPGTGKTTLVIVVHGYPDTVFIPIFHFSNSIPGQLFWFECCKRLFPSSVDFQQVWSFKICHPQQHPIIGAQKVAPYDLLNDPPVLIKRGKGFENSIIRGAKCFRVW